MKKALSAAIILIAVVVICLFIYKFNQRKINTVVNHLLNPSPVIWENIKVYYQDELICRKNDNGLMFLAWGSDPEGFIGISKPRTNSAQDSILNIKNSNNYVILNEYLYTIYDKAAYKMECLDVKTKEFTVFILVKENNIMIMYAGPQENYQIFQKTINGIRFE